MKNALFAIMLLVPVFATAQKQAPNPSDYSVAIHVQSSHLLRQCTDVTNGLSICWWVQRIDVLINEKKYELSGRVNGADLLRVGDFHVSLCQVKSTTFLGALRRARYAS